MEKSMLDIAWVLICAGMVFLMQAGFLCLESGLTRSKNNINVAFKNLADAGLAIFVFWISGFALMYGGSLNGWIGTSDFLVAPERQALWGMTFFIYQAMFCSTAITIISGSIAERARFKSYLLIAFLVSTIIYPIFGHWVWNGANWGKTHGWLGALGFVDFAGASVVHSVGGWVALAAVLVIGPRSGRFPQVGPPSPIPASNLSMAMLGVMLLWFGWFGFNGGSTLGMTERVPLILVNTMLAAVSGLTILIFPLTLMGKKPKILDAIGGLLAGLVSITACAHVVSPLSAATIGGVGALVMLTTRNLLFHWKIDDAVDAIPIHLGPGIWGTFAVSIFGNLEMLESGLGHWEQFKIQSLGIGVCFAWAFGLSYIVLRFLSQFFDFRVSDEQEHQGLNISEHDCSNELSELLSAMTLHENGNDLSARVPVEPFTLVGLIAERYNQVMESVEHAIQRTNAIVNTAMDGIVTFSKDNFQITSANPAADLIFRCPRDKIVGESMNKWFRPIPTGIIETTDFTLLSLFEKAIERGKAFEVLGLRADGSTFPSEMSIARAYMGKELFFTGTFHDISERKQAEDDLKMYYQTIQRHQEQLIRELEQARETQKCLLPHRMPSIPNVALASRYLPMEQIGGDFYNFYELGDDHYGIMMADATGHGIPAALISFLVSGVFTTSLLKTTSPKLVLSQTNKSLLGRLQEGRFATLFYAVYDANTQILTYSSAGHPPCLVIRKKTNEVFSLHTRGLVAGILPRKEIDFEEKEFQFLPGDKLLIYTDGITEITGNQKKMLGQHRLIEFLKLNGMDPIDGILDNLLAYGLEYSGLHTYEDDVTLIGMEIEIS